MNEIKNGLISFFSKTFMEMNFWLEKSNLSLQNILGPQLTNTKSTFGKSTLHFFFKGLRMKLNDFPAA